MNPSLDPDLSLTSAEHERFNQAVAATGLNPTTSWATKISLETSGAFPTDYVTSHRVASLSELKQLIGIQDDIFQDAARDAVNRYPTALAGLPEDAKSMAAQDLADSLNPEQHGELKKAADLFLFANSAKIAGQAAIVEALNFPLLINIVAARSLELEAGVTLRLTGSPWLLILGSLSFGRGAQITSTADTVFNVQVAHSAN